MSTKKLHVFFRRVSTAGQDIITQEAADLPYREKLLSEEIYIVNENAISANKLFVNQRPEMEKVISLIKQDKVHTLYAFDRTRLFRDHYEGMWFSDIRIKHGVELVFTSEGNGHLPSTDDIFLEGILSMFSDIEGKNIARRSEETRRRYPPRKLGYVKEPETRKYKKDPLKQELITAYFQSLKEVASMEQLAALIEEYRKKLKTRNERLIDIIKDPFYAAYDLHKGEDRLSHVEPYLQLNEYFDFQERLGSHLEEYIEQIDQLNAQNIFIPRCGHCHKPMNYWKDNLNQYAFYSCSNKHQKVTVPFQEFVQIIQLTLEEIVTNLDSKKLLNHSITRLRQIKKEFEIKYTSISHQLMELTEQLLLNTATANDWKRSDEYKKLSQLKEEQHLLVKELEEKEQLLEENKEVVDAVNKYLHDRCKLDPSLLYSMFIKDAFIYEDFIDFEVCKFDYLENMQSDFIYKGEHLA